MIWCNCKPHSPSFIEVLLSLPRAAHSSLARLIPSSQAAGRQVIFILSRRVPHVAIATLFAILKPMFLRIPIRGRKRKKTFTTHSTCRVARSFGGGRSVGRPSVLPLTLQDSLRAAVKMPRSPLVSPIPDRSRYGRERRM